MSTTATPPNHFEAVARTRKAIKLAGAIIAAGGDETSVDDPTVRGLAVQVTGVNEPSDTTWQMTSMLIGQFGAQS